MQGSSGESAKEKKHGEKQKAELDDNGDGAGTEDSLSVEKMKKNKKQKVENGRGARGMVETPIHNKDLVEESAERKGKDSREDGGKKKKKKKDKNKVSDLEPENWEASESSKGDRASEGDQRDEMRVENIDGSSDNTKRKTRKKKHNNDLGADRSTENSNRGVKKKRKKKQIEDSGAEENIMESDSGAKKKRKKKQEPSKNAEDQTPSSSKSAKKVTFSDQVDVFPLSDGGVSQDECEEDDTENVELVRGKRFSEEEDKLVKAAVLEYIDHHGLGNEGLDMVLKCKSYPQVRNCWKEIGAALPWRTREAVYYRAHILFERDSERSWTPEQLELVKNFAEEHGPDWKTLAEAMGKHRWHVKDTWRRIKFSKMKKGKWSREEYQNLFDLVNTDLMTKALQEKNSKHGMLRDNIPWTAISDQLGTRNHSICCLKWYNQLTSPMVAEGIWDNVDDYLLLNELLKLDAACIEDVDWDSLLENRSGELCRKRWNQMVLHIGVPGTKSFSDQVEILANRYRPELAEDREDFDNRPYDDA